MRKKLLSEAQVRRFQSLASIRPLHEMDSSYKKDDEAYMGHEDTMMEEEEMDDESEMDEADVEMDEELVQKFMDAVDTMQQVADVLNPEGGMGAMDAMDDAGEEPMELDAGEEGEEEPMELDAGEEGEEDEEAMLEEALRGISYVPSQKEVVKVVAQRVAKRLQEAKRAEARLNRALGKRR